MAIECDPADDCTETPTDSDVWGQDYTEFF